MTKAYRDDKQLADEHMNADEEMEIGVIRNEAMRMGTNGTLMKQFLKLAGLVVLLNGCSTEQQVPPGAQLAISPPERTLTIDDRSNDEGVCVIDADQYVDWPIVLALTDSNGMPVGHQDVQIYLDFAANTFSGYPVMALYDDRRGNGNGVIDDFELVSDSDDDIATVKTDILGGDRPLLLRINVSCPFRGEVFAFVEGVTARATIDIVARSDEAANIGPVEHRL